MHIIIVSLILQTLSWQEVFSLVPPNPKDSQNNNNANTNEKPSNDSTVGGNFATDAAIAAAAAVAGGGAVYVASRANSRNARLTELLDEIAKRPMLPAEFIDKIAKRDLLSEELKHVSENMEKMKQEMSYLREGEKEKSLLTTRKEEIRLQPDERKKVYESLFRQLPVDTIFSTDRISSESMKQLLQILGKWYLQDGGILAMSSSAHNDFNKLREALIEVIQTGGYYAGGAKSTNDKRIEDPYARIEKLLSEFIISLRKDLNQ